MHHQRNRVSASIAVALALTLFVPAMADAQTKVKAGWNMFSPEQDVEIGRQSAAEVEAQLPLVTDSQVNAYVNEIGQRLAAQAPGPKFSYRFRVVNASDLNAFALPGGFLYINRGVLETAKNDSEVAGVLAHEIAHAALRHGTANASKQYATQTGASMCEHSWRTSRRESGRRHSAGDQCGRWLRSQRDLSEVQPRSRNPGRHRRNTNDDPSRLQSGRYGELLPDAQ
jgi:predicted Zn-dependent protease